MSRSPLLARTGIDPRCVSASMPENTVETNSTDVVLLRAISCYFVLFDANARRHGEFHTTRLVLRIKPKRQPTSAISLPSTGLSAIAPNRA
jgi:hypothetical protein